MKWKRAQKQSVYGAEYGRVTTDAGGQRQHSNRGKNRRTTKRSQSKLQVLTDGIEEAQPGSASHFFLIPCDVAETTSRRVLRILCRQSAARCVLALPGLEINGGVRYMGDRAGDFANTFFVPSYTVFDLGANYTRGPWRFALNVTNVGDKEYFAGALTRNIVMVGDPRMVTGSVQFSF